MQIQKEHTALVIDLLQDLGFINNFEKSVLTPSSSFPRVLNKLDNNEILPTSDEGT